MVYPTNQQYPTVNYNLNAKNPPISRTYKFTFWLSYW